METTEPISLDVEHLPDDTAFLKALIVDLVAALKDNQVHIEKLRHQLYDVVRRHYGRKSETLTSGQQELFRQLIDEQLAQIPELPVTPKAEPKVRKGHGRRKPSKTLPKKVERYPLPESQKICNCCHEPLKWVGEETRSLVDYVPASLRVREQIREKWACGKCERIVSSELPDQPIQRCMAGEGLLANVIVSKYSDGLPLNRLAAGQYRREGFEVSSSTMCGWVAQSAELLAPLGASLKENVLQSETLHADDTPVPVLDILENKKRTTEEKEAEAEEPPGKRKIRKSRLWAWLGDKDHPHTVFDYAPDWSQKWPQDFLGKWSGFLQADGYKGYDAIYGKDPVTLKSRVLEAACWSHVRRKFYDARTTDKAHANEGLAFIGRLYDVESLAVNLDAEARRKFRQKHSKPVLNVFKKWLDALALVTLPKSGLGEAIGYALRQWTALRRYAYYGHLAIDNNAAENALRCVAVGRKAWLFCGSDAGGRHAALFYSIVASCKRNKVDPFIYLRDVLGRIASHPASKIRDLLPAYWTPKQTTPALTSA